MQEGVPGDRLGLVIAERARGGPAILLHAGVDLSRRRLEVCLLSAHGELVAETVAPPACKTDKIDAQVLAVLSQRDLVPAIWLPDLPLVTAPGFGWIDAFTVASEIGDIERFPSPAKLGGYTRG
jgi:transposase